MSAAESLHSASRQAGSLADVAGRGSARWLMGSLLIGIIGTAALVIGGLFDPAQFFRAYLAAYLFCLNMGLGAMVVLMVYHLTGGGWGFLVRRILEAGVKTLPLSAIGFLPVALGIHYLYPFAQPSAVAASKLLQEQRGYMNDTFFWVRAAIYFVLWLITGFLLLHWSRAQERTGNPWYQQALTNVAAIGGVFFGISIHFAGIDWVLALQPEYHSTITGPLLVSQGLITGFGLTLIVLLSVCDRPPLGEVATGKTLIDLGNLLLTFVVLWSYLAWFEFMLIWIANMQADVVWYGRRIDGFWRWLAVGIALLQFVVPFVFLLQRSIKRTPRALRVIAALGLVMQMLFTHFQILPAFRPAAFADWWMSLVAPFGLGG
ncbi:MAG TPA: hypothetical protein VKB78_13805, partial [Pirellulales bacterium]|nr:hypothetical protein [Pirellulales bacterium]